MPYFCRRIKMADVDIYQMNALQFDVLREIGNIGAGNATTALSKIT